MGAVVLFAVTASAAEPLQPQELSPDVHLDRSGFPELVIHSAVNGLLLGAIVTQTLFEDPTRQQSGALVGLGAGIVGPILLLRGQPVHSAQAAFYNFGMRWGLLTGVLLPASWGSRTSWHYAASTLGLTAAGLAATIALEPGAELEPGQVSALGTAHTFGTVGAALVMLIFDVVPDNGLAVALPALTVSNAGLIAAWVMRDRLAVDRRRLIWADVGGYLGLGVGLGAGYLAVGQDPLRSRLQVVGGTMLAGMAAGLVLGYALSDGLDDYRRAAPPSTLSPLTVEAPRPALLAATDPRGEPAVAFGLELVRGTW